jgi:hypothetical protein
MMIEMWKRCDVEGESIDGVGSMHKHNIDKYPEKRKHNENMGRRSLQSTLHPPKWMSYQVCLNTD